jgi:hypothetical protein
MNVALYRARIVSCAALAGGAVSGIFLHHAGLPFDCHIPGAILGTLAALANWTRIAPA